MLGIVIPAYKRKDCLKNALQSLVDQTEKKFFVIVVDDHSPEPLESIVASFEDKLHLKYVYTNENKGPGAARQVGLEVCYASNFDLVMFMDSDDLLYPHAVNRLVYEINHNNADVVSSAIWVEKKYSTGNLIAANNKTWLHGKIFRTQYLKENNIKFPQIRTNEDLAFNLMAIENTKNFYIIKEPLYLFRDESNSITRSGDKSADILSIDYIRAIYFSTVFLQKQRKITPQILINIFACYNHYQIGLSLLESIPDNIKENIRYLLSLSEIQNVLKTPSYFIQYSNVPKQFFIYKKTIYYHNQTFKEWLGEFTNENSNN